MVKMKEKTMAFSGAQYY